MSITVHHLNYSRSLRILWLLEELELDYTIQNYQRNKQFRAPPELQKIHPLGRAPVVEVDGKVLAESGAIIEYFADRQDKLRPSDKDALLEYRFFLHYAEGSAMPPLLVQLLVEKVRSTPLPFFIKPIAAKVAAGIESGYSAPAIELHFNFVNDVLGRRQYFASDEFSGADIQMYYAVEAALSRGPGNWSNLTAWRKRIGERPAFVRALEKGGPALPSR